MSRKHEKFLNLAERIAELSEFPGYRVGAVIENSGNVLAVGFNRDVPGITKNRNYKNACVHAELQAISRLKNFTRGSVVCGGSNSRRQRDSKRTLLPLLAGAC